MPFTLSPLHEQFLLPPPAVRKVVQHLMLLTVEAGAALILSSSKRIWDQAGCRGNFFPASFCGGTETGESSG